ARTNVGNFVSHDAGQFILLVGGHNETGIDVKETARQSKCIDLVGIHNLDCKRNFRVGISNQILSDSIHVFSDDRIVEQLDLTFHFGGELSSKLYFLVNRCEVDAALVDIASPDIVNVGILPRRLLVSLRARIGSGIKYGDQKQQNRNAK